MSLKSQEERYQEWLTRLEIPLEETTTVEKLQTYLRDELGMSAAQIDALVEATSFSTTNLAEAGIHPVIIEYPWGREVRYGVEGHPGLWGYESAIEWYQVYEATKP